MGGCHASIKAFDLAYGRIRSPDLDKQEEFLTDFGMVRADRTQTALYMRGTDAPHHIHVTELGEPRYVGIAVHAAGNEDLEKIARVEGASKIEEIDEPGGGKRVRLTDPDGYQVEIVHGMAMLDPIRSTAPRSIPARTNTAARANCSGSSRAPRTSSGSAISS